MKGFSQNGRLHRTCQSQRNWFMNPWMEQLRSIFGNMKHILRLRKNMKISIHLNTQKLLIIGTRFFNINLQLFIIIQSMLNLNYFILLTVIYLFYLVRRGIVDLGRWSIFPELIRVMLLPLLLPGSAD